MRHADRIARLPLLRWQQMQGFTLLEVLIALVVLGVALTALVHAAGVSTRDFGAMRERTLAGWVAANVLTRVRLTETTPAEGRRDGQVSYAGRDWYWDMTVAATPDPTIRRLELQVFTDEARTDPVVQMTGFTGESLGP
ncbi:type II secretion system minor pseudopilin GspI [Tahibacter amnicola]|uniref:Type II secretion system protein I n=1 Tax=Tahibacter amnicola TaxID=2976241 RepID=A0ABY6BBZ3_9GAMM|nr:type II secretion system minor pseudopilin GspI [Tahibacter amnicola]UXI67566.1 type II secretion system minor pseudopilin GspI [Tahibacter amnicola]